MTPSKFSSYSSQQKNISEIKVSQTPVFYHHPYSKNGSEARDLYFNMIK